MTSGWLVLFSLIIGFVAGPHHSPPTFLERIGYVPREPEFENHGVLDLIHSLNEEARKYPLQMDTLQGVHQEGLVLEELGAIKLAGVRPVIETRIWQEWALKRLRDRPLVAQLLGGQRVRIWMGQDSVGETLVRMGYFVPDASTGEKRWDERIEAFHREAFELKRGIYHR